MKVRSLSRLRGRAGVGVPPQSMTPQEDRTLTRRLRPDLSRTRER